jgi:TrmH family RNA methyltransferase
MHGAFLVEGADLVAAGLAAGLRPQAVFVTDASPAAADLTVTVAGAGPSSSAPPLAGLPVVPVTRRVAERISTLETPADVAAIFPLPQPPPLARATGSGALVIYADRIADPGNLGTLLRAAAAFGAVAVLTSPGCADHLSPKVVRASMGAIFTIPTYADAELAPALRDLGDAAVYGLVAHGGADLRSADLRRPAVLCVGAERAGLSAETAKHAHELLTIPLAGAESLNAGVAGAIALYEFARRHDPAAPAGRPAAEAPAHEDESGPPPSTGRG